MHFFRYKDFSKSQVVEILPSSQQKFQREVAPFEATQKFERFPKTHPDFHYAQISLAKCPNKLYCKYM